MKVQIDQGCLTLVSEDSIECPTIPGNLLEQVRDTLNEFSDEEIAQLKADYDAAPKAYVDPDEFVDHYEQSHGN